MRDLSIEFVAYMIFFFLVQYVYVCVLPSFKQSIIIISCASKLHDQHYTFGQISSISIAPYDLQ